MTQEEYVFEFVDAHHHLWDLKRLYYAWLTDKPFNGHPSGDYSKIMKNYLVDDLRREAEAVNLIKSIHIETADGETDPVHETQWLQEVADEKACRMVSLRAAILRGKGCRRTRTPSTVQ
ncbi:hypothetical protein HGG75_27405 [Ochrobactrum pseudogrignonense]|nr:hypothetical protein [Brucella pseudogrignonensis]